MSAQVLAFPAAHASRCRIMAKALEAARRCTAAAVEADADTAESLLRAAQRYVGQFSELVAGRVA